MAPLGLRHPRAGVQLSNNSACCARSARHGGYVPIEMWSGARTCSKSKVGLACAVVVGVGAASACDRGDLGRGAQTTTTSAWVPRPDATGTTSRTIDNAGFVDNGGRTSDETSRAQTSGMRATEVGSERITGTPGSGQPIPFLDPSPRRRAVQRERPPDAIGTGEVLAPTTEIGPRPQAETPPPSARTTGPAPHPAELDATERIARARCDRQVTCDRIGPGRSWASEGACMMQQRPRASDEVNELACARGVDAMQLGMCLDAIRQAPCTESATTPGAMSQCQPTSVCMP